MTGKRDGEVGDYSKPRERMGYRLNVLRKYTLSWSFSTLAVKSVSDVFFHPEMSHTQLCRKHKPRFALYL